MYVADGDGMDGWWGKHAMSVMRCGLGSGAKRDVLLGKVHPWERGLIMLLDVLTSNTSEVGT